MALFHDPFGAHGALALSYSLRSFAFVLCGRAYLLFSPIGLVGGLSNSFWPLIMLLTVGNGALWVWHVLGGQARFVIRMTKSTGGGRH